MKKRLYLILVIGFLMISVPGPASARGTRYFVNWPAGHIGPVYVQIYDIRCNPPYELLDRFRVWVTWENETKCYDIENRGSYTLKLYKYRHQTCPMIISGIAASFKIRYSMVPPWI
jgi:hypothetical protein